MLVMVIDRVFITIFLGAYMINMSKIFFIAVVVTASHSLVAMEFKRIRSHMNPTVLPPQVINNIFIQLINTSKRSSTAHNTNIVPFVASHVKALALTNKKWYLTLNDDVTFVHTIIDLLASQLRLTSLHIANEMSRYKTPGALEWVRKDLETINFC